MKKIFCLIALMIATVSLASAQVAAYSLTKTSGTYAALFPGKALDLSTVKYVPAEGDAKAQNEAVAFACGADGAVQGTSLTEIKGLPLGFDFEIGSTTAKYFAVSGTGVVYLSDTETFKVWPAQPYNALTASSSYSSVPVVGISGSQSKVRITDQSSIAYNTSGGEGQHVFTAQFKNVGIATNYNGTTLATANMQVKLYEENDRVEIILGEWTCEGSIPGVRIGLAGFNGDLLNLKGSLAEPQVSSTSSMISSLAASDFVPGTTYAFDVPAPCVTPTAQPTDLTVSMTSVSAEGSFTAVESGVDKYLIVLLQGDATFTPADGETYASKDTPAEGVSILDFGTATTYRTQTLGNLTPSTNYTIRVYSVNNMCKGGPLYNLNNPAEVQFTTALDMPASLVATPASTTSVKINVAADSKGDQVLVAVNQNPALNFSTHFPESYGAFGTPAGTYKVGDEIEGGGRVVYVGPAKDGIVADGFTPNQPVYVNAWSTDGAGNYGTIYQEDRTSTELQLPYAADYHNMGTYMEPAGYVVNDEYISNVTVDTGADGHTAANGFSWKSAGAAGADDMAVGTVTLPAFQIPAAGARMTFDYQIYIWQRMGNSVVNWEDHIFDVEIAEAGTDNYKSIFQLGDGKAPEVNDVEFHTYSVDPEGFKAYAGKKVSLRFKWSRYSDAYSFIHNIFIEEVPEIDYASEVTVAAVDGGDVTIDWTDRYADATKWEVRYQKVGTTSWSEPVATTEKPYTITGLDLSSQYTIQVRVVADDKVSPWAEVSARTGLGAPFSITYEAVPFTDGWEAKQFAIDGDAITFTDDAVSNWRFNANYGLMYSGNYDRALVTPTIKLGEAEQSYTITITPGRVVTTALKNASYIAVSKDNGETWKLADAVAFDGMTSSVQMNLSGNVKIAVCIAKGNTTYYIKGFEIEKSPSQFVLGPEDISAKKAYIIYTDARGGLTIENEEATNLRGTLQKNLEAQEQDKANVFQQFAFVGYEGTYYLYSVGAKKYVSATGLTDQAVNAIQFADADETTVRLLFDGSHNINLGGSKEYVCGSWSTKDAGNSFKIEIAADFDQSELTAAIKEAVEQAKRNEALAAAIATAKAAYAENNTPGAVSEEGLITSADQFYSDYSDSEEGTSFEPLIDGDPNTIWHSDWHDEAPEGAHSLEVTLPETLEGDLQLSFVRRSGKNGVRNQVTTFEVQSLGAEGEVTGTTVLILPFGSAGETATGCFTIPAPTQKLRFVAKEITTPEEPCWNCAGFQLYKVIEPSNNSKQPELAADLLSAIEKASDVEDATNSDIERITQATDTYKEFITKTVYTYTINLVDAPEGAQVTIGDGVYTNGQTVKSYEEITAESVEATYEGYTTSVKVAEDVITVTYTKEGVKPDTETKYFTAQQLRDEVAKLGGAEIAILGVTTTGNKYITEVASLGAVSEDGTLEGARDPQEAEVLDVFPVEGGYILHRGEDLMAGYIGLDGNTFKAVSNISEAVVWNIVGPDEEGYGTVSGYDDLYTDIAMELNPNMVRFIQSGTSNNYLNGQASATIGGVRTGTGAWSFNYVRNALYQVEPPAYQYIVSMENAPEGATVVIDECTYENGETVYSDTEITAADVTAEYEGYTTSVTVENGVITVTYVLAPIDPDYRPALAEAINAGEEALEKHLLDEPVVSVKGKGEGLIKSADQFASEYADSDEGKDFGALIDEEPTTYWHTDWHGTAPEGAHSFDVNLPENTITSFVVTYTGRYNQNNCSPIVMTIYGKNEGGEWETITTLTQEDGLGANAGQGRSSDVDALSGTFNFQTEKAYTDFRFEAHAVWADAGVWTDIEDFEYPEGAKVNDEACFNYSEFQMYEAVIYKYDIDPAIAAALEAAVAEGKALYNDETIASDDAQLQAATDAINEAVEAVENAEIIIDNTHTYTIKFVNAPEDGAHLQIDGNWYSEGEIVESETELTAEDITVSCDPAYTYEISIKNGVITVTFQKPDGINGITGDAKNATIFNLQGQQIGTNVRGISILNGRKVLVK